MFLLRPRLEVVRVTTNMAAEKNLDFFAILRIFTCADKVFSTCYSFLSVESVAVCIWSLNKR